MNVGQKNFLDFSPKLERFVAGTIFFSFEKAKKNFEQNRQDRQGNKKEGKT